MRAALKSFFRTARDVGWSIARAVHARLYERLPIEDDLVVFDNFNGRGYGCNPKYIAEALAGSGLRLVWLAKERTGEYPDYIDVVRFDSPAAWKALATARVRVTNVRNYKGIPKKKGQYFIQTWHSMLGFKASERSAERMLDKDYIKQAKIDGRDTDLMIANNAVDELEIRQDFWYGGPVMRAGLPRLAPIVRPSDSRRRYVRKALDIQDGAKVLLYAPTFRDYDMGYCPSFDPGPVLAALESWAGQRFSCVVRLHPNMVGVSIPDSACSVIDASTWPDSQDVLSIADVLVTDYSSIAFESLAAELPVFLYVPDLELYESQSRNLTLLPSESPFPSCKSMEELVLAVESHNEDEMRERYAAYRKKVQLIEDGMGDKAVALKILEVCLAELHGH